MTVPSNVTFNKYTIIDRKAYATHLTEFLNSKSDDGYVINLNAEWGAGKTTFLQCWYNELREHHPVIYFDAWKSDFSKDAMMALTECFHTQLISPLKENEELYCKVKDHVTGLVKVALPSLVVGYLKHKTGVDSDDSLLSDITNELGIDVEQGELAGALKETMKAMLNQKKKVDGLHAFRDALEDLAKCYLAVHNNKSAPIYVLVDELDRCRPSYAIEVIECVKHFFNTKKFVFVLATDTEQLQHSIKAIYGQGFNSASYLSRFFDTTLTLESPSLKEYVKLKLPEIANESAMEQHIVMFIAELFDWHKMDSLREIEKVFDCLDIGRTKSKCFKIIPLIVLAILKRKYPDYFQQFLASGTPPYVGSYTGPDREDNPKHVPIPPRRQISYTMNTKANLSYICNRIITSIDSDLNADDSWLHSKIDNHAIHLSIPAFLSFALLNEGSSLATLDDYLAIINFAGHIK